MGAGHLGSFYGCGGGGESWGSLDAWILSANPSPFLPGHCPPQRLVEERDALREANEELRCAQVQQSCLSQAGGWWGREGGLGTCFSPCNMNLMALKPTPPSSCGWVVGQDHPLGGLKPWSRAELVVCLFFPSIWSFPAPRPALASVTRICSPPKARERTQVSGFSVASPHSFQGEPRHPVSGH